ncbi:MAG: acetolactate synthase large subunit [Candidatus Magasanikbacteria bacterium]
MKASDVLVHALENEGVKYIFGVPGEENLDFLESLSYSSIKFIITRHEQAAGFMAANYGRLTGSPGVCLSTLGPGATNLVTAAAYAQLGAMPMIMITGQKPINKTKQGHFQIVRTVEMFTPLTKMSKQITHADHIPSYVREAFRVAREERPGAVHLELPEDVASEETNSELYEPLHALRPSPYVEALRVAQELVQSSKHPLILIGASANRKRISQYLTEFINKTGIPFVNTQMGKGVVDERHPLYLGTAALSEGDYVHCAIEHADLIINVGHDTIEKPPFIMRRDGARVIHFNFFAAKWDSVYFPQHEVVGDIGNGLEYITRHIVPQTHWDFSYYHTIKQELETHLSQRIDSMSFPLIPQRIIADVRSTVPEDGIVTLDNGMYKIWFARNYKTYKPNTLLLDNALATMGAGLPSAMVAKLLHPNKKVISVVGDGGFMMNSQELETAIRLKLDLVILILVDNAYGMIQWKQQAGGFADFGLEFGNPDFVKYAQSYGAQGYRVSPEQSLHYLLEKTLNIPGVHVIEVPIDYSENVKVFGEELKNKLCKSQ